MDEHELLAARATALEKRYYKFRVTSRGFEVYWRHHVLKKVEHYSDDYTADDAEHIRLARENMRQAVEAAEAHEKVLQQMPWWKRR